MFGYLRPYKPELKVKDYSIYKAVYCGLCNTLGKRYGFIARNILTYDATLMCIIDMSRGSACKGFRSGRCPVKPYKKCDFANENEALEYWADVSVILAFYKVLDNYKDGGFLKKAAILPILPVMKHLFKKAAKNNPFAAQCAKEYIKAQTAVEEKNTRSVDEAAQPTAELMSKLLSKNAQNETERRVLDRAGYFIGRWIYFADAADDLKDDKKSGAYNPFAAQEYSEGMKIAERLLNSCIFEIGNAISLLQANRFGEIINNVVYLGLPKVKEAILSGLDKKERIKRFPAVYRI